MGQFQREQLEARSNNAPATYLDGANVIFDDRAGPGSAITVSIGANVSPASVIFNNSTASYTLSSSGGFGIVGNTAVTVSGGGVVTIANSNGYTGGTTLSAGQMNINNNSVLGSGNFIIAGGVIDSTVSGVTLANNPQFWTGDFTFNGSNNLNLGAGAVMLSGFRNVTLNANTLTIGGAVTNSNGLSLAGAGTRRFQRTNLRRRRPPRQRSRGDHALRQQRLHRRRNARRRRPEHQ